jgi:hypothetical protein
MDGVILNSINLEQAALIAEMTTLLTKLTALTGNPTDSAIWTNQKAGFIDSNISYCAQANTAVSSAVLTPGRCANLDNLIPVPQVGETLTAQVSSALSYLSSFALADGNNGVRIINQFSNGSATLVSALSVTGSGWLAGCFIGSPGSGIDGQLQIIVDGTTLYDSTYYAIPGGVLIALGLPSGTSTVLLSPFLKRFNASLQVNHKANSTLMKTSAAYLIDP